MRSLLSKLLYALVYGLTWLIAQLPRPLFYGLADLIALLLCHVLRYRRDVVRTNLERSFPGKTPGEIRRITWAFYRHLSDLFLEQAFLMHAPPRRIMARCQFTNLEALTPYYQQGKSVVIAAAHYGNWEFLTCVNPQMDHLMLSIFKPINNKRLERLMNACRERMGCITVPMRSTLRAVAKYAQEGTPTLVGLICDQTPSNPNQYWGEFLHQDTLVFSGIENIARKYDWPVFFCNMQQPRRGEYTVTLELITDTPNETPKDWVTEQHLRALERCIVARPELWLWSHRRWKHKRPEHLRGA